MQGAGDAIDQTLTVAENPRCATGVAACTCPRCGDTFSCGARAEGCWCQSLPPADPAAISREVGAASCLCPFCLRQTMAMLERTA